MAKIEYVGLKPSRADTVAGTGKVWRGAGDVQEVPDLAAPRLLRHPDIWRLHVPKPSAPAVPTATSKAAVVTEDQDVPLGDKPPAAAFVMGTPDGPLVLDAMDRETLMALAKEAGLKPHPKHGVDKLRAMLVEAFPVKAA